eukprot:scaffold15379_cov133-Isochrysis_galbana.AAC.10
MNNRACPARREPIAVRAAVYVRMLTASQLPYSSESAITDKSFGRCYRIRVHRWLQCRDRIQTPARFANPPWQIPHLWCEPPPNSRAGNHRMHAVLQGACLLWHG